MFCKRAAAAAAALVLLGGCEAVNRPIGTTDPYMGEATKWNAAVQVINPDPVYTEDDAQPGDSGQKAAEAVKRYRTDQVKQTQSQSSTSSSGSGSGGPQ